MCGSDHAGSAMLAVLALLVAVLGVILLHLLDPGPVRLADREGTMRRLAGAAAEVTAYSLMTQGVLPCPDMDVLPDGYADDACLRMQGRVVAGWLPWRTLGLAPLRDDGGRLFGYVRDSEATATVTAQGMALPIKIIERKKGPQGIAPGF
ncbi:MAG: hypothetical protein HQL81_08495 [Magnetococcales bacterium]|nr:hypothetical protein [Magnetococcales bacterium]